MSLAPCDMLSGLRVLEKPISCSISHSSFVREVLDASACPLLTSNSLSSGAISHIPANLGPGRFEVDIRGGDTDKSGVNAVGET